MNVLGYVTGLRSFIKNGSLVEMRRHEHPEHYQESFLMCRQKLEAIIGVEKVLPLGQLTLFDLFEM